MSKKKIGGQPIDPNLRKLTSLVAQAIRKQSGESGRVIELALIYDMDEHVTESGNVKADGRAWRRYRTGATSFKTFARVKSVAMSACEMGWLDRRWMEFFMPGVSEDYLSGKSKYFAQELLHESLIPDPIEDEMGEHSCGEWELLFDGTTIEIEWARRQWYREIKGVIYDEHDPIDELWDSGEGWVEKSVRRHTARIRSLVQLTSAIVNGWGFADFADNHFPHSLNEYINFRNLEEEFCSSGQRLNTQESHQYELMLESCGKTVCEEYRAIEFTDSQYVFIALVTSAIKEMGYDCSGFSISQIHDLATTWLPHQNQKPRKQKRRRKLTRNVAKK